MMAVASIPRHVVLTGPPGIGKTTLVQTVCEVIKKNGIKVQGFYSEEVREHGRRIGFDIVTLDGQRGVLARVGEDDSNNRRPYRVGQYQVRLQSFEQAALPSLKKMDSVAAVYVLDEVGKMELFSQSFVRAVQDLMSDKYKNTVLTTIPVAKGRPIPFVEEIRSRKDAILFQVTRENRDHILDEIVQAVMDSLRHYSSR